MPALRLLGLVIIGGLVTIGVMADQRERSIEELPSPVIATASDSRAGTWFCAGGSGSVGAATVGLEVVNAGLDDATVDVQVVQADTADRQRAEVVVPAASRVAVNLPQLAPEATWLGAIVESDNPDVVVEQTFDGLSGTDRAPCATTTGTALCRRWCHPTARRGRVDDVAADESVQDDASPMCASMPTSGPTASGDRGPARRVSRSMSRRRSRLQPVSTRASRSPRSARRQSPPGPKRHLRSRPAVTHSFRMARFSASFRRCDRHWLFDRIHVTNPSDEAAEVDLEIVTDGSVTLDPVELTIRAGRTVVVDVAVESRLAALPEFSVVARSLTGQPVAVAVERRVELGGDLVAGTAAMGALDAAASEWIVASDGNVAELSVVNPLADTSAVVELWRVGGEGETLLSSIDLAPGRRQALVAPDLDARDILRVRATSPVVVGRASAGFTSRQMLGGVIADGVVLLDQLD